jgi:hypothetical protein
MERYQANPTPEAAMEAQQQMLNFHQTGEAAELRREMAEKFRQNAKVQAYLGMALSGKGMAGDSTIYFQRALELWPDLPEARVGWRRRSAAVRRDEEDDRRGGLLSSARFERSEFSPTSPTTARSAVTTHWNLPAPMASVTSGG